MTTLFAAIVDKMLPQLPPEEKNEIYEKVGVHLLEFFKDEVFSDDPSKFSKESQPENYIELIMEKYELLPEARQQAISEKLESELTRVMRQVYQAAA